MTLHDRRETTDEATPAAAADLDDLERKDLEGDDLVVPASASGEPVAGVEHDAMSDSRAWTAPTSGRDEMAGQPDPAAAESVMSALDRDAARGTATPDSAATPDSFATADAADAGAAAGTAKSEDTTRSGDWRQVLLEFVDHPREAVEKADRLVDDAVRALTERINSEHSGLRDAWRTHGEPSTEDLRRALRGYRDFFEKILSSR